MGIPCVYPLVNAPNDILRRSNCKWCKWKYKKIEKNSWLFWWVGQHYSIKDIGTLCQRKIFTFSYRNNNVDTMKTWVSRKFCKVGSKKINKMRCIHWTKLQSISLKYTWILQDEVVEACISHYKLVSMLY